MPRYSTEKEQADKPSSFCPATWQRLSSILQTVELFLYSLKWKIHYTDGNRKLLSPPANAAAKACDELGEACIEPCM